MPNLNIAHIHHGEKIFQVLNQDGTDWDEEATNREYRDFLASIPVQEQIIAEPVKVNKPTPWWAKKIW